MKSWLGRVKIREREFGTFVAESREYDLLTADDADNTHAALELQDQWAAEGKPLVDADAFEFDPATEIIFEVVPVGHPGGLIN